MICANCKALQGSTRTKRETEENKAYKELERVKSIHNAWHRDNEECATI